MTATPIMGTQAVAQPPAGDVMESVLLKGDLAKLTEMERVNYYNAVCKSLGLNPLTRPFEFMDLGGKRVLYAKRDAADQLRKLHNISLKITSAKINSDGIYTVEVEAVTPEGRTDMDVGAVALPDTVKGEFRANLILKCVTKAKRRATLSICGLGFLDETEVEDIPTAAQERLAREQRATAEKLSEPLKSSSRFEELDDEVSDHDGEALLFSMAIERAKQGEVVFNEWFKEQTKEAKAWLREHKAELVALYPK